MCSSSLRTVSGSQPVDVLIVGVTPGAPGGLSMWLSPPPSADHLVKGHVTVDVFVYVKLCWVHHCRKFRFFG